jgi:mono/diheme cytochrome c family protein
MRIRALSFMGGLALAGLRPALAQDVAAGATVYGRECGRCHAPRAAVEYSDRQWDVIMRHMQVVAVMPARDTRAVLAFLQASNGGGPETGSAAPAAEPMPEDARAMIESLGCRGCHTIGGVGGSLGPSLDGVGARQSADDVSRKLRDPRFNNPQSIMPVPNLSEGQRARIVEYLMTLR